MRCRCVATCVSCVVLAVFIGCGQGSNTPTPVASDPASPPVVELSIGEGIQFKNLTIFPVVSSVPRDEDRFITLDEGILAQTVKVVEVGALTADPASVAADQASAYDEQDASSSDQDAAEAGSRTQLVAGNELQGAGDNPLIAVIDPFGIDQSGGANVNRVLVLNRSEQPLYLMPGETIVGGQQDRTLAEEMIIPPGDKPVEVAVYCVEHARWSHRSAAQTAALAANTGDDEDSIDFANLVLPLASAGQDGFLPGAAALNKQGRLAVQQARDQNAVWEKVAEANAKTSVDAPTGGFTHNFVDPSVGEELQPYLTHFQQPIESRERIVGVIVAINGHVESIDVFESTPLFRKLWPKLLKGYVLDAAIRADEEDALQPVLVSDAQRFYDDLVSADVKTEDNGGEVTLASRESATAVGFSLHEHEAGGSAASAQGMGGFGMGAMGGMGGSFGGQVHSAGYSK